MPHREQKTAGPVITADLEIADMGRGTEAEYQAYYKRMTRDMSGKNVLVGVDQWRMILWIDGPYMEAGSSGRSSGNCDISCGRICKL